MKGIIAIFYIGSLLMLFVYGMNCYFLMLLNRFRAPQARRRAQDLHRAFSRDLPRNGRPLVAIQLPMFNERYVAERLIEAACATDYPRGFLQIQALDDSTDDSLETSRSVVERIGELRRKL